MVYLGGQVWHRLCRKASEPAPCSILFHLVPACSSLFQLVPACSSLFQLVPACSSLFQRVPRVCLDHFGSLRTFQDPFFTTLLSWNPLRSRYKCSSAVAMTEELDIESKVIGRLAKGTCLVPEARVHKSVRTVRTVRTASWPRHANTILYRETRLVGLGVSGTPQKSCSFSWVLKLRNRKSYEIVFILLLNVLEAKRRQVSVCSSHVSMISMCQFCPRASPRVTMRSMSNMAKAM